MTDSNILIKKEYENFKKTEEGWNREIDEHFFFDVLEKNGYDYTRISRIIDGGVFTFAEQHEFNIILRHIKRHDGIKLMDSVLYLEDTITLPKILRFIDGETEWELKDELADKYGIDKDISNIYDILS